MYFKVALHYTTLKESFCNMHKQKKATGKEAFKRVLRSCQKNFTYVFRNKIGKRCEQIQITNHLLTIPPSE